MLPQTQSLVCRVLLLSADLSPLCQPRNNHIGASRRYSEPNNVNTVHMKCCRCAPEMLILFCKKILITTAALIKMAHTSDSFNL